MDTMQFRDYIFANNPQTIQITHGAGTVTLFCPGKGEVVQQLGGKANVVRCTGSFFGSSYAQALAQVNAFQRSADKNTPGSLFLPGMKPFFAYLREFVYEANGDGRIIPYTMIFVEAEEIA